jgi:hypothetical protein
LRFAKRSSTRAGLLVLAFAAAAVLAVVVLQGSGAEAPAIRRAVTLHGTSAVPAAWARAGLVAAQGGTEVHLWVYHLPPQGVYEVRCGRASAGTFRVDRRGAAHVSLTSAARPGEYELMLVTRPADGERGRRVLSGTVEY